MGGDGVRLPSRFPVGTRYVIEGHEGRIRLRYLEFPDGRKVDLPADLAARSKVPKRCRPAPQAPGSGPKKIEKINSPGGTDLGFGN